MSAAALIPAAKIGVGLFGSWLGSKIEKKATQPTQLTAQDYARTPQEQATYAGITRGADQTSAQSRQLSQTAQPLNAGAANYYGALVRGNKSAVNAATATERGQIGETYRGADAGASRMRGPARDYAKAELLRQKTSQLAGVNPAARQYGAAGAAQLGTTLSGQAASTAGAASSAYGAAANNDTARDNMRIVDTRNADQLRLEANQQQQQAGGKWGSLFSTLLGGIGGGKSGGSSPMINGYSMTPFQSAVSPNRP